MSEIPELLLPAGSLSKARMAVAYGADAVYAGAPGLSMRPESAELVIDELAETVALVHAAGRRIHVCINTLMFQEDLPRLREWLEATRELEIDALLVSDPGAFALARELRPDVRLHISTQMSTANGAAARFWRDAGASRIVLARECSIADAGEIARDSGVEVETFVHGAMCMAVSGRCLLSAHLCGHSGSKGDCKHSCRWEWQLVEQKRPGETMPVFETGRSTLFMGSTDLCLLRQIPLLMDSGIRSLKVEGRMKSEYYVATVARVYRAAIDAYAENPHGFTVQQEWLDELEAVSHRPYEEGFAFGYPLDRPESLQTHNRPVSTHEVVALVTGVRDGRYALEVKNSFLEGDELEWIAPGMASGTVRVEAIAKADGKATQRGHCGSDALVTLGEGTLLPETAILRRRTAS